ncbi:MAG: hypothetical protein E7A62_06130 [Actinomycetaceae bacterium]|nr:hypothetical protein [Actinomycetaceae bacterium]MDU0970558.1 hypothetical protein [Actinomycetaceae bacterium]
MALFELERGRLIPAQFGRPIEQGLGPDILESIRSQVLEVIGRPLFPVAWQVPESETGPDGGPHCLTALDASGQVVSVEVLRRLDAVSLISAMGRLGEIAKMGWLDLAHVYPGGPDSFRAGWAEFRESMPPTVETGPRLFLVVGEVDPGVDSALVILAAAGLEIHQVRLREMSNGRRFLEVHPVSLSAFAPRPQLGGHSSPAPQLEWSGETGATPVLQQAPEPPQPTESREAFTPQPVAAPEPPRPVSQPAAPAPSHHEGPAYVSQMNVAEPPAVPAPHPHGEHATSAQAPAADGALHRDYSGLRAIADVIGSATVLLYRDAEDQVFEAMLESNGMIVTGDGQKFDDADAAYLNAVGRTGDGWASWRIGIFDGPTLGEAIDEMNADLERDR